MASKLYLKKFKIGLAPGTLQASDEAAKIPLKISLIDYDGQNLREEIVTDIQDVFECRDTSRVSWINIDGKNVKVLEDIGRQFGIHPLVLEDIMNNGQRPKVEAYGDYFFIVLKMIRDEGNGEIGAEQVSVILGKTFVISFQEKPGDIFDPLRQRIRDDKGRVRRVGPDYLANCLIDAIVDHYFVLLETIGEQIDQMEAQLFADPPKDFIRSLYRLKTQVIFLRKHVWPLRDVINSLTREESDLIKPETKLFLRDAYDHAIHVNETLEAFREALTGIHDIYLSDISNRMNEVMKFLTVFASIFIPLTFVAGIYGMNFENIPELRGRYNYFVAVGVMFLIAVGMLLYFRKKRWL